MSYTLILDDPAGNSFVENPMAPSEDPNLQVSHYNRTEAQSEQIGVVHDDKGKLQKNKPIEPQVNAVTGEITGPKKSNVAAKQGSLIRMLNPNETLETLSTAIKVRVSTCLIPKIWKARSDLTKHLLIDFYSLLISMKWCNSPPRARCAKYPVSKKCLTWRFRSSRKLSSWPLSARTADSRTAKSSLVAPLLTKEDALHCALLAKKIWLVTCWR